jgi:hypothetical protein
MCVEQLGDWAVPMVMLVCWPIVLGSPYLSACSITPVLPGHQYQLNQRGGLPGTAFQTT